MSSDSEVSVKDIVNFYIKINDASKAKKDLAQLSSKDKLTAFEVISHSSAAHDFRIEIAKYFIYDLDARVRKKAEVTLESLIPGWVSDPAESILRLLQSSDQKGGSRRNAAVKFLFGIVDSGSLRDTFMTLLSSRNRAHLTEIIAILEEYIDTSTDEHELVKIFDATLEIVLSDDTDHSMKHHASSLLSSFFKKVETTKLGETLRKKYIEKQVDKAEGIYRYLCSGTSGLSMTSLEDLLRPLAEGGLAYQKKILTYFVYVLEGIKHEDQVDAILDTYPDYWNQDEPPKETKIKVLCHRMITAVDELWEQADDPELRSLIIRIRYGEYANKRELFDQIKHSLENETLSPASRDKIGLMLGCFLLPEAEESLKLLATQLLLFKIGGTQHQTAALTYLRHYVENKNLNYAEKGSIAAVLENLLNSAPLDPGLRGAALQILFILAPEKCGDEDDQKAVLTSLRRTIEGDGFESQVAEQQVVAALKKFATSVTSSEKLKKAALYLEFKIRNPSATPTWDKVAPPTGSA